MKRLRFRFLLLACASGVSLLLAEGAARLLPLFPVNAMGAVMRPDPVLDHSLRPGSAGRMVSREYDVAYRINAWGLRDVEPEPGAILLLGDSFMEGYGVAQDERLSERLRRRGLKVVNAGVKSYSPLLEYLFLRHRGLALAPDTVLLFFDLSDPANDEYYSRRLILDDRGLPLAIAPRRLAVGTPAGRIADWLDRHSTLYAYALHFLMKHFPASQEDIGYAGAALDLDPLFPGRDSIPDDEYVRRWSYSFRYLRLIRDLLKERGVAFAIVTYPYGHQVSAGAWAEGRKGHGFPPGVSSDRPFRFLTGWAAGESIPVVALRDTFGAHPTPDRLFFAYDGHWTPLGHQVAADAVAAWLEHWPRG